MLWLLLLAALLIWFFWPKPKRRLEPPAVKPVPKQRPKTRRLTSIKVVCVKATPLRQEWKSLRTGRLFDVVARAGVPDAEVGDEGFIAMTDEGWRIVEEPGRFSSTAE